MRGGSPNSFFFSQPVLVEATLLLRDVVPESSVRGVSSSMGIQYVIVDTATVPVELMV